MDFGGGLTAGEVLDRIRRESRDESEKGRWFEQLFMRLALQEPEFEIDAVWRWPDWPEREELTGRDGRDIGIDLVTRRTSGEWVAIQCKCYDDPHRAEERDRQVPQRVAAEGLRPSLDRGDVRLGQERGTGDPGQRLPGEADRLPPAPSRRRGGTGRGAAGSGAMGASGGRDRGCRHGACEPRPRPPRDGLRHGQDVHFPSHSGADRRGWPVDSLRGAYHRVGVSGAARVAPPDGSATRCRRSRRATRCIRTR